MHRRSRSARSCWGQLLSWDPTLCLTARHIPALIYGSRSAEQITPSTRTPRSDAAPQPCAMREEWGWGGMGLGGTPGSGCVGVDAAPPAPHLPPLPSLLFSRTVWNNCGLWGGGYKYECVTLQARTVRLC